MKTINTNEQALELCMAWEVGEVKTIKKGVYSTKLRLEQKGILPALGYGVITVTEMLENGEYCDDEIKLYCDGLVGCDVDC